jgi:hypothetical protein
MLQQRYSCRFSSTVGKVLSSRPAYLMLLIMNKLNTFGMVTRITSLFLSPLVIFDVDKLSGHLYPPR